MALGPEISCITTRLYRRKEYRGSSGRLCESALTRRALSGNLLSTATEPDAHYVSVQLVATRQRLDITTIFFVRTGPPIRLISTQCGQLISGRMAGAVRTGGDSIASVAGVGPFTWENL